LIIWGRDNDEYIEGDKALIARAPEMAAMLKELSERKWSDYCCGVHCDDGTEHDDQCVYTRLAALIKELP
jgi:hypothetical protein